jgi:hypothetical protein
LITYQRRERGPQAKPIVAIGAGTANFKRGPVAIPKFSIAGWINSAAEPGPSQLKPDLTEHLQERSALSGKETSTTPIPRSRRKKPEPSPWEDDDLADDEIPY